VRGLRPFTMTDRIPLTEMDVAYLVGKEGQTRIRLENFSGARLSIDRDAAEVRLRFSRPSPALPLRHYFSLAFVASPLRRFTDLPI